MARPRSDIDPRKADALHPKRRRRKRRDRPDPPPQLKAAEAKAVARLKRMPIAPGIMYESRDDGPEGLVAVSPWNDEVLWDVHLHSIFGTRSHALAAAFERQLRDMAGQVWDEALGRWKIDETQMNAALSWIASFEPRNPAEASTALQLWGLHRMQARLMHDAVNSGGMVMEREAALVARLAKAFAALNDSFRNGRSGGRRPTVRQTITVRRENHVHYHDNRGGGGASDSRAQPDATDGGTVIAAECRTLPGPEEAGRVVPLARRKG